MSEAVLELPDPAAALSRALDNASTGVLRIVCGLGFANAVLFAAITAVSRPSVFAVVASIAWTGLWWVMRNRADRLRLLLACHPSVLVAMAAVGMTPVALDGGLQGTLGGQALWLTWVAAVMVSAPMTVATSAAMAVATAVALAASGMTVHDLFVGPDRFQAVLSICTPLLAGAVGLAVVGVFRGVLGGVGGALSDMRAGAPASTPAMTELLQGSPPLMPPLLAAAASTCPAGDWGLTQAERDVVERLRAGLTAQQIALERNGSVLTVRTHIKRAKRKVGARTLSELIARTWPVP